MDEPKTPLLLLLFRNHRLVMTALVAGLLVSGVVEAVGIATLVPLLSVALSRPTAPISGLDAAVLGLLDRAGIPHTLGPLLGFAVAALFLKAVIQWLVITAAGRTISRISTQVRLDYLDALIQADWRFFTRLPAGESANILGNETRLLAGGMENALLAAVCAVQCVMYLSLAFLASWEIAVCALVSGVLILYILRGAFRQSRVSGQRQTELTQSLVNTILETLNGIKPLKAMCREASVRPLLENETRELNHAQERLVTARETLRAFQEPISALFLSGILYFLVRWRGMPFDLILIQAFLFSRLGIQVSNLSLQVQAYVSRVPSCRSVYAAIARARAAREERAHGGPSVHLRQRLEVHDLRFSHEGKPVLRDLSFTLPAGAFCAISGASGGGKTTLVDLLCGLYRPEAGSIRVDGVDLREADLSAWRTRIGYVPQEMTLFHDSIRNNVTLGDPAFTEAEVTQALRDAEAWSFVESRPEGLDATVGEKGSALSGGQRQRIALARALIRRPDLLILDEVTTSLDPATEEAICATLARLAGQVTILAVSHQPSIARRAGWHLVLAGGTGSLTHLNPSPAVPVPGSTLLTPAPS